MLQKLLLRASFSDLVHTGFVFTNPSHWMHQPVLVQPVTTGATGRQGKQALASILQSKSISRQKEPHMAHNFEHNLKGHASVAVGSSM